EETVVTGVLLDEAPASEWSKWCHLSISDPGSVLSKGRSSDEIIGAIRAAAQGRRYVTPTAADALLVPGDDRPAHERLSQREHQVFVLVLQGRAPGDIAAELALTPSTVSSHLAHIREKLGVRTNGEVMQYAWRAGLAPEG